jgi:hypothetical protein
VGHYIEQEGRDVVYVDPLADNQDKVVDRIAQPSVILWAHDRQITYEYTGDQDRTQPYCVIPKGSMIIDPWRKLQSTADIEVIHYGNTRRS